MTRIVLASGVFDALHPGHLAFLKEAQALGESLVVVVTSDEQAGREKRPPRHPADQRMKLVGSLRDVDRAFVGPEPYDVIGTVKKSGATIIALGHDQPFDEQTLADELAGAGIDVDVIRCAEYPSVRTSELLHDD